MAQKFKSSLLKKLLSSKDEKEDQDKSPIDVLNELLQNKQKESKKSESKKEKEEPKPYSIEDFKKQITETSFVDAAKLNLEEPESLAENLNAAIRFATYLAVQEAQKASEISKSLVEHKLEKELPKIVSEKVNDEAIPEEIKSSPVNQALYETIYNQLAEASPGASPAELRNAATEFLKDSLLEKDSQEETDDSSSESSRNEPTNWAEVFDIETDTSQNQSDDKEE